MKKVCVLTSMLALAACGGGSGGGVSDGLTSAQRAAVESNKNVTGMLTYIETDSVGNTLNSRSAAVHQVAGQYDLRNVKFANIDEDFEDVGEDDGLQFVVDDNNKIVGFNMGLKQLGSEYPNHDSNEPEFKRVDETNKFRGLVKTSAWVDGELEYNSLGKTAGLQYSDFGNIAVKILDTGKYEQRLTFVGGYDDAKRIDESDINTNATFKGYATGSVVAVLNGEDSGKFLNLDTSKNASEDRKVATYTFNNGVSTLNAKFDNWYDVEYVKDGDDKSVTFSNYTTSANLIDVNGTELDAGTFRMLSDNGTDSFVVNTAQYQTYDEEHNPGPMADTLNSDVRYFGDGGIPSEAVGLVQLRDCNGAGCGNDYDEHQEVRMNISFGGKAQ